MTAAPVRAVALDAGETLVDETGQWSAWAAWLGQPPFTLMVALGAVLERGEPFKKVFALFDENFDIDDQVARRNAAGTGYRITAESLHDDVRDAIDALSRSGLRVAVAGTMTEHEREQLTALGLSATVLAHRDLGSTNRDPAFYGRLADRLDVETSELCYISHRNDVVGPAARDGGVMFRWLRRGPLARIRTGPVPGFTPFDSLHGVVASLIR